MNRLRSLPFLALALLIPFSSASAQPYPSHYIRIVTAGAGTMNDVITRRLAQRLQERLGQGVVVENQPAAGMTIAARIVASAAPDGYTLLMGDSTSLAAAPSMYKNLGYDPVTSFRPITLVAVAPSILAVHPSVPAHTLAEFIEYTKQQKYSLLFASAGHGTMVHRAAEQLKLLTGADLLAVQYKGGGAALLGVLAGEAKATVLSAGVLMPYISEGKLRPIVLAARTRFAGAPDLPTAAEAGLPEFVSEQWIGLLAPAGTPDAIIDKLNAEVVAFLNQEIGQILRAQGAEARPGSPAEFAAFIAAETAKIGKIVEAAKLRID